MLVTQYVWKTLSLWNSLLCPAAATAAEKSGGLIYKCSTGILGMLPVTVCSLFWIMFPFSNQGPTQ
jgi:hypothetical protein